MVYITPLVVRTEAMLADHIVDARIRIVLLRAICRNTAKTEFQAQFCETGVPRDRVSSGDAP